MLDPNITYPINKLIPVLAVFTAWFLGFTNQQFTFKRQDKIKLKRLLFNLMELRYWVEKELQLDKQMNEILDLFLLKCKSAYPCQQIRCLKSSR